MFYIIHSASASLMQPYLIEVLINVNPCYKVTLYLRQNPDCLKILKSTASCNKSSILMFFVQTYITSNAGICNTRLYYMKRDWKSSVWFQQAIMKQGYKWTGLIYGSYMSKAHWIEWRLHSSVAKLTADALEVPTFRNC